MIRFIVDPRTHETRAALFVTNPMRTLQLRQLLADSPDLLYGTPACGSYNIWIHRRSGAKILGGVVFPLQYKNVFTDIDAPLHTCPLCCEQNASHWVSINGCGHTAHYKCLTTRTDFACPVCEFDFFSGLTARVRRHVHV